MLKISAVYFMWNTEISQDAPNYDQDDLVLLMDLVDKGIIQIFFFVSFDTSLTMSAVHRGVFCQFSLWWIHYYCSDKYTGLVIDKSHHFRPLCSDENFTNIILKQECFLQPILFNEFN